MQIKVKDMLELPVFKDFSILAGEKGLNRVIKSVSVMDAPDIYKWLKGGEFVITSGYSMGNNSDDIENLITQMNVAGAAAFGIKIKRYIGELSKKVINIADKLDFPIISIPVKYAFVDIINPICSELINEQARRLSYSENIHRSFTQLAIEGGDIKDIIDALSSVINRETIFFDTLFDQVCGGEYSNKLVKKAKQLGLKRLLKNNQHCCVEINGKTYGYIFLSNQETEEKARNYQKIAIENASTVIKLYIQKKISNLQIESKYREEFIYDLISNNIQSLEEIEHRASMFGWEFKKGLLVMVVDIDNFKIQYSKIKDDKLSRDLEKTQYYINVSIIRIMKKYFDQVIHTSFAYSKVFLIEAAADNLENFLKKLTKVSKEIREKIFKSTGFTLTIGIGGYKSSVEKSCLSYEEAKKAVKLGRVLYKGNETIIYQELGSYKVLGNLCASKDADEFCKLKLGKLLEYDSEHNSDLLSTLKSLEKNIWNLKETAEELFIHYNTIKYRVNKICEVQGFNLSDSNQRFDISLALRLMEMKKL